MTTSDNNIRQENNKSADIAPLLNDHSGGQRSRSRKVAQGAVMSCLAVILTTLCQPARADETCSSPYLARIEGQEEFVYVWTLGVEGLGDGSDKLVTVDVKPGSPTYGKVINSYSVGGRNEAHHGGFTDDRRQLWLAGLESSKIFIFDVYTDPAKPRLVKTIDDFAKQPAGRSDRMASMRCPAACSFPCALECEGQSGRTALVEYSNDGNYIATHWLPTKTDARGAAGAEFADGYGYDARVLPRKNALLTSSFTGWNNYMREFGQGDRGSGSDEAVRKHDGDVGFPRAAAEEGFPRSGRAAGNPLGVGQEAQLRLHRHGADLEALARPRRRRGRMAGEGSRYRR